jgi:hypothetical protein
MPAWTTKHPHATEEERRIREAALDETLAGTFPASDPLSSNPNPDDHDAAERNAAIPSCNRNHTDPLL